MSILTLGRKRVGESKKRKEGKFPNQRVGESKKRKEGKIETIIFWKFMKKIKTIKYIKR